MEGATQHECVLVVELVIDLADKGYVIPVVVSKWATTT